jgi:hypothetical protein
MLFALNVKRLPTASQWLPIFGKRLHRNNPGRANNQRPGSLLPFRSRCSEAPQCSYLRLNRKVIVTITMLRSIPKAIGLQKVAKQYVSVLQAGENDCERGAFMKARIALKLCAKGSLDFSIRKSIKGPYGSDGVHIISPFPGIGCSRLQHRDAFIPERR